jgi:hypothetical protein
MDDYSHDEASEMRAGSTVSAKRMAEKVEHNSVDILEG